MIKDVIFENQKMMLSYYKDYYDDIQKIWLESYNQCKLNKKINYDFIIFNQKFYFDNNLVDLNSPFSLSWVKPKPIICRLKTNKMIKKLIKWCKEAMKELQNYRDEMIQYLCIPYKNHSTYDNEIMKRYCRIVAELNLARTILKSINYEKFYHFL